MTPTDLATALAPVGSSASSAVGTGVSIGIPVLLVLVALGIIMKVMGKFGVRK